jgi:hypothetical protein
MSEPAADLASALLGTWTLESWTTTDGLGTRHPFGVAPTGLLVYAPDGGMAALVASGERPSLPGASPRAAPPDALAAAFLTFFTYAGRWRVEGDVVVHRVEVALNPAMQGTEQRRTAILDGPVLHLLASETWGDVTRAHALRWRRG